MVNMRVPPPVKKDLEKYTKFLALKSAQIIIQSRLGEKTHTPCKPTIKSTDWFNINIADSPEVLNETKKIYNADLMQAAVPLCVEISLKTSEGDEMVLETWCLSILPETCDTHVFPTLYNRLGILLKSLVSVTRVTPAYKLSRRQGPDSFVICYRIYMHEPNVHCLGEGSRQVRIGLICTPIGTIQLSVYYRTKMTISPTQNGKKNSIMLKSDHFNSNPNPRKQRNCDDINDLTKPLRSAAPFADSKPTKIELDPQIPGVTRLLALGKYKNRTTQPSVVKENEVVNEISSNNVEGQITTTTNTSGECLKTTSTTNLEDDIINNQINEANSNLESMKLSTGSTRNGSNGSIRKSVDQEFWMKELNAPFADRGPVGDLMLFYKDFQKSPQLPSTATTAAATTTKNGQTASEINSMLEMYESQLTEYDALVESFCQSPDNS